MYYSLQHQNFDICSTRKKKLPTNHDYASTSPDFGPPNLKKSQFGTPRFFVRIFLECRLQGLQAFNGISFT